VCKYKPVVYWKKDGNSGCDVLCNSSLSSLRSKFRTVLWHCLPKQAPGNADIVEINVGGWPQ